MPSPLKPCPSCRALVEAGDKVCPYCGEDMAVRRTREVQLGASNPGLVTGYIVGVCVFFFLLEVVATLGTVGSQGAWQALFMGVPAEILVQMGGRYGPLILQAGEWWRLIVPVFLHGSFLHLLFNGMALVQVGPLSEQAYGRSRFIIIFLLSGIAGSFLGLWYGGGGVGIGASGALFGLIGAAGLYGHRRGDAFGLMIRRVMVQWGLYALVFGLLIRADNAAHVGGLLSGIALSFIIGDSGRYDPRLERFWVALAGILVAATIAAFAFAVYGYTVFGGRA